MKMKERESLRTGEKNGGVVWSGAKMWWCDELRSKNADPSVLQIFHCCFVLLRRGEKKENGEKKAQMNNFVFYLKNKTDVMTWHKRIDFTVGSARRAIYELDVLSMSLSLSLTSLHLRRSERPMREFDSHKYNFFQSKIK